MQLGFFTQCNKKKKKSVCSRTQICSWNLCVNSWKYCWVLSKTKACDMVDLIFSCSFKSLLFHVEGEQPGTALLSVLISGAWFFPTVTAPALPVLPNYEGSRIMFFLLFADFSLSLLHLWSLTEGTKEMLRRIKVTFTCVFVLLIHWVL